MTQLEAKVLALKILCLEISSDHVITNIIDEVYSSYYANNIVYSGKKEANAIVKEYKKLLEKMKVDLIKLTVSANNQKIREQARSYYNRLLKKAKEPYIWFQNKIGSDEEGNEIPVGWNKCEKTITRIKKDVQFDSVYTRAKEEYDDDERVLEYFKELIHEEFRIKGWYDVDS